MEWRAVIGAKTSEVIERAHQPATSLALAAFRSGSLDWERRRVFFIWHETERRTYGQSRASGFSCLFIYLSFFFFFPCLWLSAARCPPSASISIATILVLLPLTYMARRNEAKLPLEPPLGAPWVLASFQLPLLDSAIKHGSFWKLIHRLFFMYSQETLLHLLPFLQVLILWPLSCVRAIVVILRTVITNIQLQFLIVTKKKIIECVFMHRGQCCRQVARR